MNLELLRARHSVRNYSSERIPDEIRNHLNAEATQIRTLESGMHFQIFYDDGSALEGFRRSYGMFRGVKNYMACVIDTTTPHAYQRAGYFAEQFVMYAVSLGLATCFVGGTFDRRKVNAQLRAGWELPFIVVFGYEADGKDSLVSRILTKQIHRHQREPEDFLIGSPEEKERILNSDPILRTGLEGLACAPSAMNRQPVRIKVENGNIEAFVEDSNPGLLIDLGIGMWNFRSAAGGEWDFGNPAIYLKE